MTSAVSLELNPIGTDQHALPEKKDYPILIFRDNHISISNIEYVASGNAQKDGFLFWASILNASPMSNWMDRDCEDKFISLSNDDFFVQYNHKYDSSKEYVGHGYEVSSDLGILQKTVVNGDFKCDKWQRFSR